MAFLVVEIINQRELSKYAYISERLPFWRGALEFEGNKIF